MTSAHHSDSLPAERLLPWLDSRAEEMAGALADLVAIPTENPPGKHYAACASLLERQLRDAGLPCQRHQFPAPSSDPAHSLDEPPASLIAHLGSGSRTLYFHGHYDVVPAQSPAQFQPQRKGHFLFGRGSCDMKGGILAMLYAMLALRECGAVLHGRLALTLVPDEETGGARGSAWLASQGLLGRDAVGMLLAEPTSGVVWNANRGAISLRVKVFGKSAHVALQHRGENAFQQMLRVVQRLEEMKREVEKRETAQTIGAEQKPNSILLLGGESGGGTNFNVVPDQCWFTIDRRINPEENLDLEKSRILSLLESCRRDGIRLEWEILQQGRAAACAESDALALALAHSVKSIRGTPPRFEMCPGLLEIRFYAAQGIPAYAYGPGLLNVAHGPDEYVDLRTVRECAAIYALTAMEMLSK